MIGLILSHKGTNYGMMLQAYATQKVIEKMGFQTEIIAGCNTSVLKKNLRRCHRMLIPVARKAALKKRKRRKLLQKNKALKKAYQMRVKVGEDFVEQYLHGRKFFRNEKELREYMRGYECVIIGSDQQWAPACFYNKLNTMEIVPDDIKKASYATSLGVSTIPWYVMPRVKKYLNRLEYISVRENTGKAILSDATKRNDIEVVADPTFLLDKKEWESCIPNKKLISEKYIFCYFLGDDDNQYKYIESYAKKNDLKVIVVKNIESYTEAEKNYGEASVIEAPSVEDFVNYIRNAELVCTDSFHCTVFSIINNSNFLSFYRNKKSDGNSRNSRIDDLLGTFGMSNRICEDEEQFFENAQMQVDFSKIQNKIDYMREDGKKYLKNVLMGVKKNG